MLSPCMRQSFQDWQCGNKTRLWMGIHPGSYQCSSQQGMVEKPWGVGGGDIPQWKDRGYVGESFLQLIMTFEYSLQKPVTHMIHLRGSSCRPCWHQPLRAGHYANLEAYSITCGGVFPKDLKETSYIRVATNVLADQANPDLTGECFWRSAV